MQFDWWTFALQLVNFLVLVWLLWRFLYMPVREVIEKRKELAGQAFAQAELREGEAEAARQRFEEDRGKLVKERQDMLKEMHETLDAERQAALSEASKKAEELMAAARETIAEEQQRVLIEMREEVATLAVELAAGIMRKAGSSAPNGFFLEMLEEKIEGMSADDRERLLKDLAPDAAQLTVATAAPLTPEEKEQWTEHLADRLGKAARTEFVADPGLLGGVELRFPHTVLKFSWSDQLRKAEDLLRRNEPAS